MAKNKKKFFNKIILLIIAVYCTSLIFSPIKEFSSEYNDTIIEELIIKDFDGRKIIPIKWSWYRVPDGRLFFAKFSRNDFDYLIKREKGINSDSFVYSTPSNIIKMASKETLSPQWYMESKGPFLFFFSFKGVRYYVTEQNVYAFWGSE